MSETRVITKLPSTITRDGVVLPVIYDASQVAWSTFDIAQQAKDTSRTHIIRRLSLQRELPFQNLSQLVNTMSQEFTRLSIVSAGLIAVPDYKLAFAAQPTDFYDYRAPILTLGHPILPAQFCLAATVKRISDASWMNSDQQTTVRKIVDIYRDATSQGECMLMDLQFKNFKVSGQQIYLTDIDPLFLIA